MEAGKVGESPMCTSPRAAKSSGCRSWPDQLAFPVARFLRFVISYMRMDGTSETMRGHLIGSSCVSQDPDEAIIKSGPYGAPLRHALHLHLPQVQVSGSQ